MEKADFPFTDAIKPLLATGYEKNPPESCRIPIHLPAACRRSESFAGRIGEAGAIPFAAWANRGNFSLLKPESILRMEVPETTLGAKNGLRLGYGLANYSSVQGGVVTHGQRWRDRRIRLLVSLHAGAQLGLRRVTEQHEFGPRG